MGGSLRCGRGGGLSVDCTPLEVVPIAVGCVVLVVVVPIVGLFAAFGVVGWSAVVRVLLRRVFEVGSRSILWGLGCCGRWAIWAGCIGSSGGLCLGS